MVPPTAIFSRTNQNYLGPLQQSGYKQEKTVSKSDFLHLKKKKSTIAGHMNTVTSDGLQNQKASAQKFELNRTSYHKVILSQRISISQSWQ